MPAKSGWGLTPRQSVEIESARRGVDQVVAGCVALLRRQDADDNLVMALGGPMSEIVLNDGPRQANQYWCRVWGARGLLYAWNSTAEPAVIEALDDEHWRVREMAAKVIAKHKVGTALEAVVGLRDDTVPRVRAVAQRATEVLTAAGS